MGSIVLKNIQKKYDDVAVLHDITAEIDDGEFVVVIGESGCGKSTLLRLVCGLESITGGELFLNGKRANEASPQDRNMAMVFQSYALYPHMSVYKNMSYNLKLIKMPAKDIDEKVKNVAAILGLDGLLDRFPKNLSGGQRQRVAMGRAIIRNPSFFLFDEPLSNLDAKLRVSMRSEIKKLQKKLGITTIYVTHDQVEAMTMADKIILMDRGNIVQIGTPEDLYERPNSVFSATFLGSPKTSLIHGKIVMTDSGVFVRSRDGLDFPVNTPKTPLVKGQEVILGIRPRDFYPVKAKDQGYPLQINIYEYTGAEDILYGAIGENDISIVFARKDDFDKEKTVYVHYDVSKTHLFDAQSQKSIP